MAHMDVDVCKITKCQDVEILGVINNKDQKLEVPKVTQCQKVEVKVAVEFDKVKQNTGIGIHKKLPYISGPSGWI
ncbi:hypothetical protein C5167_048367 [Papaver somniferum]|uniref:Uncharacterized protein n=1 Tax=Papaver somniferum TaxID=3469 RepID=A0A4Y7KL47_PAPSO|nr:hypothetical protein C5167_048367 [Papaver somniferum]